LLNRRPDDIANAGNVGLDERVRGVAQIDGHERGAVDDAITATQGRANRRDVTDVALGGLERPRLPLENQARFVRVPYECPDPMASLEQRAHRVRSGQSGCSGYEHS